MIQTTESGPHPTGRPRPHTRPSMLAQTSETPPQQCPSRSYRQHCRTRRGCCSGRATSTMPTATMPSSFISSSRTLLSWLDKECSMCSSMASSVDVMLTVRKELLMEISANELLASWSGDPCLPVPWKAISCSIINGSTVVTKL